MARNYFFAWDAMGSFPNSRRIKIRAIYVASPEREYELSYSHTDMPPLEPPVSNSFTNSVLRLRAVAGLAGRELVLDVRH